MTTPEWLRLHNGELRPSKGGTTWFVYFAGEPQYLLEPLPAKGQYSCRVSQTISGKRLDKGGVWPDRDRALQDGLSDLREALGW